ncbi:hypothetical protein NDU88_004841 [Pleurodeles waltl]|uniref:Uncharacterized protein n=1 Tax=Pleurodeles waltl TaxID=8319 RepID=A0AAV7TSK9_PLEWA|nr:hypothetical protein NDU88_004841 [Pleurodeles waltl]
MGKDRTARGAQQTKMDHFMSQGVSKRPQTKDRQTLRSPTEPVGAQILAPSEASGLAVQMKTDSIALDLNLLRADSCKVTGRSMEMEGQVEEQHEAVTRLWATVMALEAHSRRMETIIEDAQGHSPRCNLGFVDFPEDAAGSGPEAFLVRWIMALQITSL